MNSILKGGLGSLSDRSVLNMLDNTMDIQYSGESSMTQDSISSMSLMSIMEQNWSVFIEKLSQSSFWKEHEYNLNSMEKDIDVL